MNGDKKKWPMLLDMTKDECKQTLRSLELSTYSQIVSVLRAQGELTKEKRKLLSELQMVFSVSVERHRAEIRRAVNDEVLNTIAETLAGPNTNIEWAIEGRRLIPLMPRVPPQIAYTALATKMAQYYCGYNASLPDPCDTAMYGKLDDVGADFDMTDSEEETEGLRYITESMIPPQYNAHQGSYTTLPLSQSRLAKERLKEKKESSEELSHDTPASPPHLSSSMSSGSNTSTGSQGKPPPPSGAEKRKRKRSLSTDHPPSHSPPPPPLPTPTQTPPTIGNQLGNQTQSAVATVRQASSIGSTISSSSMKITVTGGTTRSSSTGPLNTNSQQKVILVSSPAASGNVANIFQRSISVPILKSPSQGAPGPGVALSGGQLSQGGLLKGTLSTTAPVTSTIVNKILPRFSSSISTSILSQGSSSLPGLPPRPPQRQRSNSLILQNEGENSGSRPLSSAAIGQNGSQDTLCASSVNSLNFIGSNMLQLRSTPTITPKSNIQVKQEGGKLITHTIVSSTAPGNTTPCCTMSSVTTGSTVPSVVGGRIIGRTLPSSSQGLYVVSTSSGTITVVTRTVASASISNPRVVTVNTINNSRSSIVRGSAPATPGVSLGMTPKSLPSMRPGANIRPVMTGPKSNVIVVHKGTIAAGARPVGLHGLRDLSAKIISKPTTQGASSGAGLLSGTLIVKPSPVSSKGAATSLVSSTKETISAASISSSVSSSSSSSFSTTAGGANNLIVVDLSCENSLASQNAPAALANILHTPGMAPPLLAKACGASHSSYGASKVLVETSSLTSQPKKESHSAAASSSSSSSSTSSSSSHDISTVSASSSLPSSFRPIKAPTSRDGAGVDTGVCSEKEDEEEEEEEEEEHNAPLSNLVTSSSDAKEPLEEPLEGNAKGGAHEIRHSGSSLSLEEEEEEEDNEWLKLGLEDEDEAEMEEEEEEDEDEEERGSEVSSCTEKSTFQADDSLENEVGATVEPPGAPSPPHEAKEGEGEKSVASEASVSSSTEGPAVEKEGELQMLVEKAVEVLKGGDSDQARSLLYKAGFELIDSSADPDQTEGQDGFSISNIAGVSSSSAMLCSETPLGASTPLRDESSLGSMSELDPATGYFYSPSAGENSSEPTSNKADSPASKDDDSLTVPEFEEENS